MQYLKEYRRITYLNLLTSGRLNTYLAKIDRQAEKLFSRLVEQMKQAQGITERLKEENALEWVQRTNNILFTYKADKAAGRNLCRCSFRWATYNFLILFV